jgi:hypothetical protein
VIRWSVILLLPLLTLARGEIGDRLAPAILARKAQVILYGKVTSITAQKDEAGQIYTTVTFHLLELWKGSTKPTDVITYPGGILGEQGLLVRGGVTFAIDEEFVGFFIRNLKGELISVGMDSGKYLVRTSAGESAEPQVEREGEKLTFSELRTQVSQVLLK